MSPTRVCAGERGWSAVRENESAAVVKVVAAATLAGLVLAGAAVGAAGPWQDGRRTAERAWALTRDRSPRTAAAPPLRLLASQVLAAAGPVPGPAVRSESAAAVADAPPLPTARGLDDALSPLFDDPALGPLRTGTVLDALTGRPLFGRGADTPAIPASTTKIATAVAALQLLGPDFRITTSVVPAAIPGGIVLVGGGDPTLTARPAADLDPDPAARPASLADLADATARALKEHGITSTTLGYDTSRYEGPVLHPIGVNDNIAPVTALMADEGRLDPGSAEDAPRVADPAGAAARTFAALLHDRGITVHGDPAPATATGRAPLAQVRSMPLSALVERMLTNSDNDIAEALARQAAIAARLPVTFAGGGQAVARTLGSLGLPLAGARFADGSGLDRDDRLTAALLARLLLAAAGPARPGLRPVLSGLPVAGFTGTLADRFGGSEDTGGGAGGHASGAAGLVHAKTGTLTGVNTLAGTVVDADGRLLVFAFMTSDTTAPQAAVAALDRLAAAAGACGCR